MSKIYRQSSFGNNDTTRVVSLSRVLEKKILNGEMSMKTLHQDELDSIEMTLDSLLQTVKSPKSFKPDTCNTDECNNRAIVSFSMETVKQLIERRNGERVEGFNIANAVQYIPHEVDYISKFQPDLRKSILLTFVSLVLDHLAKMERDDEDELIKWGTEFLTRLGKLLMLPEIDIKGLIKPVKQYAELRDLGTLLDEMTAGKTTHLGRIKRELEKMQPKIEEVFVQTIASINASDHPSEEAVAEVEDIELPDDKKKKKSFSKMIIGSISKRLNRVLTVGHDFGTPTSAPAVSTEHDQNEEEWSDDDAYNTSVTEFDNLIADSPPSSSTVLIRNLVTGYIMSGHNDARVQLLFSQFAACLGVSEYTVIALENNIASDLVTALQSSTAEGTTRKMTRNLKIAAMTMGGGALIAFTAGVAAPALAAGVAMVGLGGGGVGALLGTQEGSNFFCSFFGVGGVGLTNWKVPRKLSATVSEFEFQMLHSHMLRSLAVGICVDGLDHEGATCIQYWEGIFSAPLCDLYILRWNGTLLKCLTGAISNLASQPFAHKCKQLWSGYANDEVPMSGIQWPLTLVQYASNLDNVWLVVRNCAEAAGEVLSQAIMDKAIGERPVTLVGYGMGARVIFYALLKLYKRKRHSCIKDVVLFGLPSTAGLEQWKQCQAVVAGRLVNVYSRNDWILAFLYRYMYSNACVAGLYPVQYPKVENWDASDFIESQADYMHKMQALFTLIHFDL
ncbi:bifunctional Protein of unknown function DUF726/Alpha-Beta hydrolase fold [Babesia duncani]|uniref:Transmembrane and coiled-coil domain-containing protein 4 n=1 Tax=Babesia duncani TaxID=323732 RepID=A0AAD9UNR9_9APIC|nr:bifunctional Protein of unknown function DUF726/Alpha-Beta hydrolase fold [Babesia duncani]